MTTQEYKLNIPLDVAAQADSLLEEQKSEPSLEIMPLAVKAEVVGASLQPSPTTLNPTLINGAHNSPMKLEPFPPPTSSEPIQTSNTTDPNSDPLDIVLEPETEAHQYVDPVLRREQFKWVGQMIRTMKKRKDAHVFLHPVDPIALGIPSYTTFVKVPMDLSTVEKRMARLLYTEVDQVAADINLIFTNCYTFNGRDSVIGILGQTCQAWFHKEWEKLPKITGAAASAKKKAARPSIDLGYGRQDKLESGKRRLTAPRKMISDEMKFCHYVHKESMKKINSIFAWPFMNPVDPIALGIPQYPTIIKHPMDLSTIRKNLESNHYSGPDEYEADIRLMLDNCKVFNGAASDMAKVANQFEDWFERKLAEMGAFVSAERGKGSESDDDDTADEKHISMLKAQLTLLNEQLAMLMEKKKKKREKRKSSYTSAPSPSVGVYQAAPVAPRPRKQPTVGAPVKPKTRRKRTAESDEERMPEGEISYEQKRELSDNINILEPDKLPQVFEIIKENTNLTAVEDEEIELDIDSLDKAVLWKLYLFVKRHTRPSKRAKLDEGDNTIVGPGSEGVDVASSSSEEDEDESEVGGGEKAEGAMKSAVIIGDVESGKLKKAKGKNLVKPTRKEKVDEVLPFRTEKGDVTSYTSNFIVSADPTPMKKVVAKPKYDSVLDSAWAIHESIKIVQEEPEPEVELVLPSMKSPPVPTSREIVVRSPSPEPEYSSPHEWLDLQGPADFIQKFHSDMASDQELEELETLRKEQREKMKIQMEEADVEVNGYFSESEEDGAVSDEE